MQWKGGDRPLWVRTNRDDHAKNHAFIMSKHGQWAPSPAYDITFSTGPGGQHNLDIAGEGLRPGQSHILAVAKQIGTIKVNSIPPA